MDNTINTIMTTNTKIYPSHCEEWDDVVLSDYLEAYVNAWDNNVTPRSDEELLLPEYPMMTKDDTNNSSWGIENIIYPTTSTTFVTTTEFSDVKDQEKPDYLCSSFFQPNVMVVRDDAEIMALLRQPTKKDSDGDTSMLEENITKSQHDTLAEEPIADDENCVETSSLTGDDNQDEEIYDDREADDLDENDQEYENNEDDAQEDTYREGDEHNEGNIYDLTADEDDSSVVSTDTYSFIHEEAMEDDDDDEDMLPTFSVRHASGTAPSVDNEMTPSCEENASPISRLSDISRVSDISSQSPLHTRSRVDIEDTKERSDSVSSSPLSSSSSESVPLYFLRSRLLTCHHGMLTTPSHHHHRLVV